MCIRDSLPGVGPHRKEILSGQLNIRTWRDLLEYYPYKYVDRTKVYTCLLYTSVGSSAKMTLGLVMSARAMATRCFWPPDISLG